MSEVSQPALTGTVFLCRTCDLRIEQRAVTSPLDDSGGHHIPGALHHATASWELDKRHLVAITTNNGKRHQSG